MSDEEFVEVLRQAINGDMNSTYRIIKEYEGLIVKNCIINGKVDEDCKAVVESRVITSIKKFNIFN